MTHASTIVASKFVKSSKSLSVLMFTMPSLCVQNGFDMLWDVFGWPCLYASIHFFAYIAVSELTCLRGQWFVCGFDVAFFAALITMKI